MNDLQSLIFLPSEGTSHLSTEFKVTHVSKCNGGIFSCSRSLLNPIKVDGVSINSSCTLFL